MAIAAKSPRALCVSVLLVFGTFGIGPAVAGASTCGDRVVADWSDGRIDGLYELNCYEEAVDGLPEDVRVYSSAADDISRALQARLHSADGRLSARVVGDPLVSGPEDSRAAQPPLALVFLVSSVGAFAVAGAGCWFVQRRRRGA